MVDARLASPGGRRGLRSRLRRVQAGLLDRERVLFSHRRITSRTWSWFRSIIIKWPFPRMPSFPQFNVVNVPTSACRKNATVPASEALANVTSIACDNRQRQVLECGYVPRRFALELHVQAVHLAGVTVTRSRSPASSTGGSYAIGTPRQDPTAGPPDRWGPVAPRHNRANEVRSFAPPSASRQVRLPNW